MEKQQLGAFITAKSNLISLYHLGIKFASFLCFWTRLLFGWKEEEKWKSGKL